MSKAADTAPGSRGANATRAPHEPLREPRQIRWHGGARRVPFVAQTTAVDCGAACLAMVLGYHGKTIGLDEARRAVGADRDGTDARALLEAGRAYGLRGRGLRLDVDSLEHLERGAILFWEFRHFIVFDRLRRGVVEVVDPAAGRRRIPIEQFRRSFTGVALAFEATEALEPSDRQQRRPIRRYLRQVLRHSGLVRRIIVTSLVLQLLSLALPVLTGLVVDRVVPRGDVDLLHVVSVGLLLVVLLHFWSSFLRARLTLSLRTRVDVGLTGRFVEHLVDLPYAFFQLRSAGDLLMRMNSNNRVREILTSGVLSAALDGMLVCIYLALLLAAAPSMGLLVAGLGTAQVGLFLLVRRRQRELMSQSLEVQARTSSYQVEMLSGMETLKAMGAERRATDHWNSLFVELVNTTLDKGRLDALFDSLVAALKTASPLAVLAFGAYQVLAGQMSLGTMLALQALGVGFLTPLNKLVTTGVQLQLLGSYFDRLDDVFDAAPEQQKSRVKPAARLRGRIEVEHASFAYSPSAPLSLRDISLAIEPGQHVAIVGRSGSGKSTLAKLLLGMYSPAAGRVLYDGADLASLECRSVRSQLGIVTQDPQLFSGSIRDNIALANPDVSLDDVVRAARTAAIHDDIAAMPMGYDTVLADRGLSLSGGQRQRIAIARAVVHRPAIVLFDEATSAVDAITEARVQEALGELKCTRITIAHRLSAVVDADLVLVLDAGELVEQGTYRELLRRRGRLAELVSRQQEAARAVAA